MYNSRFVPFKNAYLSLFLLLSGFVSCTSTAVYESVYIKDLTLQRDDYSTDFREIHNIVTSKHKHLQNKGIKVDSLFAVYAPLIAKAQSKEQYGELVIRYFAELQNGHSRVSFRRDQIFSSATLVERRLFVNTVNDKRLMEHGVQAKDEIISINGVPALEWLEQEKSYVGGSTEQGRTTFTVANNVFSSYFGGERHYGIQTAAGLKEITIPFDNKGYTGSNSFKHVQSKTISDSVGYIAINGMKDGVVAAFEAQYKNVKDKPYLIVDIRSNGGGNSGYSEAIASYLIKQKHKASVSRKSLKPAKDSYKGKLFLLTSGYTYSSAESFAIDLKEAGAATIVGGPTAGDTGNGADTFVTRQGIGFSIPTREPRFSANGFPMEGTSITPAYLVNLTVADYLNGKDTVLEYTLNLIRNSKGINTSQIKRAE